MDKEWYVGLFPGLSFWRAAKNPWVGSRRGETAHPWILRRLPMNSASEVGVIPRAMGASRRASPPLRGFAPSREHFAPAARGEVHGGKVHGGRYTGVRYTGVNPLIATRPPTVVVDARLVLYANLGAVELHGIRARANCLTRSREVREVSRHSIRFSSGLGEPQPTPFGLCK
jgi:hypothetical protein